MVSTRTGRDRGGGQVLNLVQCKILPKRYDIYRGYGVVSTFVLFRCEKLNNEYYNLPIYYYLKAALSWKGTENLERNRCQ